MSHIVEVKFLEETLLLTCETTTTISQLGNLALLEYEQAYVSDTPKTIKHIRDGKGRILSGSIQLVALNLDKYVEVILNEEDSSDARALDPSVVKAMYHRWQEYTARQMELYFQNFSSGASPSTESLQLLDDLKYSKSYDVQLSVLQSYELILGNSRNRFVAQAVADGIQYIFRSTDSADTAMSALRLLQTSQVHPGCSLDSAQLLLDLRCAIRRFPSCERDIIAVCESISISSTPAEAHVPHTPTPVVGSIVTDNTSLDQVAAPLTQRGDTGGASSARPGSSGGMSLDRIVELLNSEDARCRSFALEKMARHDETDSTGRESSPFILGVVFDNDVAVPRKNGGCVLLRALFGCLKASLQPPEKPPSRQSATPSAPMAYLIAESTLRSTTTHLDAVQGSLRLIYALIILLHEQGLQQSAAVGRSTAGEDLDSVEGILSERWRLLLTLAHAHERRDSELCQKASDILLLLVSTTGWDKYRIKLDRDSVIYFLDSEVPIPRTFLAIEFLLHCLSSSKHVQQHRGVRPTYPNPPSPPNDSVIESWLCDDNFLVLRAVWKWSVGNYRPDVAMKALEVLSLAAGMASVKKFLVKFEAVDKLLVLLGHLVEGEMELLDVHRDQVKTAVDTSLARRTIRSILKCLVNIYGASSKNTNDKIASVISADTRLGLDIKMLAIDDDITAFYAKVLGIE